MVCPWHTPCRIRLVSPLWCCVKAWFGRTHPPPQRVEMLCFGWVGWLLTNSSVTHCSHLNALQRVYVPENECGHCTWEWSWRPQSVEEVQTQLFCTLKVHKKQVMWFLGKEALCCDWGMWLLQENHSVLGGDTGVLDGLEWFIWSLFSLVSHL